MPPRSRRSAARSGPEPDPTAARQRSPRAGPQGRRGSRDGPLGTIVGGRSPRAWPHGRRGNRHAPLFATLRAQPRLTDPYGRLWRAVDLVREHRGDGHLAACVAAGLDPVRMGILAEVWVGYAVGEYSGTRAWPQETHEAAAARPAADGLIADGAITEHGREVRDAIEAATDASQADLVAAVGDDLDAVVTALDAWSAACVEARAFPGDPRKRAAG